MIHYEYFPPACVTGGRRRSVDLPEDRAARVLGERLLNGWDAVSFDATDRDGKHVTVVALLGYGDRVWALYHSV